MNAAEIAAALKAKRAGRHRWMARCPVHEDATPSLSIREGITGPLVHCHAGCGQGDVIDALRQRPLRRNTLVGFAQVRIVELRMIIADVAVHEKANSRWASLPSKPVLDHAGVAQRDAATNKIRHVTILEFDSPAVRAVFSTAAIAAVLAAFPDAFAEPMEVAS
jgi:hypothetical protein